MKSLFLHCRLLVTLFIFIGLSLTACGTGSGPTSIPDRPETPEVPVSTNLLWSDEFDGVSLDSTKWNIETGMSGWGNNEWQNYTGDPENLKVENGNLVITARCDSGICGDKDGSITSARINTKDKFTFQYGTIQARIKAPPGQGMWAAFWMLGSNFDTDGWPKCGEVDIMEIFDGASTNDRVHSVLHWYDIDDPRANNGHVYEGDSVQFATPLSDDFHTYELNWDENRVVGKVDNQQIFTKVINPTTMSEFLNDFFLVLNVAVGGNLGADPVTDQTWQHEMLVDWIRVYGEDLPPSPPPAGDATSAGIYTETAYDTTLSYSQIINSANWSAHGASPDEVNQAVTPMDGDYVLAVDFLNNPSASNDWGGGIFFDFGDQDISAYSTLSFSLDATAYPGFDELTIALEDTSGLSGKTEVKLSSYTPTVSGNWETFAIPLSDFTNTDFSTLRFLGFLMLSDGSGNIQDGTLYFDAISVNQDCMDPSRVRFDAPRYAANASSATITVIDTCSAGEPVTVSVINNSDVIDVDVAVGANGTGAASINFGATNDATDTIDIAASDSLELNYLDINSTLRSDSADVVTGPIDLESDDNSDGQVYVYATNPATVIDWTEGVDYSAVDEWSSGATLDDSYTGDATYGPDSVFLVTPSDGWDPGNLFAGALAFIDLNEDFAWNFTNMKFKFKGTGYTSVFVKFAGAKTVEELEYQLSAAQDLGGGWYEVTVPLAAFGALYDVEEMAILNYGTDTFYLTDIYFE
jgi:beta-glucanase (GH16 family)